jgi:hypothetical protein
MEPQVNVKSKSLYDTDYQLWIDGTVAQLKSGDFSDLDVEHLIEEVESLGKSQKHAVSSYLLRLCEHLFKLKYWQSDSLRGGAMRDSCFRGWILEIGNFRFEIELIIKDSPSLKPFLSENFLVAYQKARKNILKVMKTSSSLIPEEPEFTLEQALDEDWLPWRPE